MKHSSFVTTAVNAAMALIFLLSQDNIVGIQAHGENAEISNEHSARRHRDRNRHLLRHDSDTGRYHRELTNGNATGGALRDGLIDPNVQPMFKEPVPRALDPSFLYEFQEVERQCKKCSSVIGDDPTEKAAGSLEKINLDIMYDCDIDEDGYDDIKICLEIQEGSLSEHGQTEDLIGTAFDLFEQMEFPEGIKIKQIRSEGPGHPPEHESGYWIGEDEVCKKRDGSCAVVPKFIVSGGNVPTPFDVAVKFNSGGGPKVHKACFVISGDCYDMPIWALQESDLYVRVQTTNDNTRLKTSKMVKKNILSYCEAITVKPGSSVNRPEHCSEKGKKYMKKATVSICKSHEHETGLVDNHHHHHRLKTSIYGYGDAVAQDHPVCTWPGKTFETQAGEEISVLWENNLPIGEEYLITSLNGRSVVDKSFHWAYSLEGYKHKTIKTDGVPVVVHMHGGNTDRKYDGNPEYFFSPGFAIKGPQWVEETYFYNNNPDEKAAQKWYHDHALGITRLNVYTGMAGFFFLRDDVDTGKRDNPLHLPAYPYEEAFAIQDRMFKANGELFYPAFPGDPFYSDFIDDEGAVLPEDIFPGGGATGLAEFFGDVMVVNGKIWPRMQVEPRNYRFRLLNGCDSRFLVLEFYSVEIGETAEEALLEPTRIPFYIIGSDAGLAYEPKRTTRLLHEPGARYDIVIDFEEFDHKRVIMYQRGRDEPFGGDIEEYTARDEDSEKFQRTDRIMAFDVDKELDESVPDNFDPAKISESRDILETSHVRKVALFEGTDEFGRLQPVLGTVGKAFDYMGRPIYWPDNEVYQQEGLAGKQMEGTMTWHEPTTENPALGTCEEWEIWNVSADAHPIHLHLVFMEVVGRNEIVWDTATSGGEEPVLEPGQANEDGTYLESQPLISHNGEVGQGFRIMNPKMGDEAVVLPEDLGIFDDAPLDVVTAFPGQVTRIRMNFNKPGRYVWHCHILSHEDHDMMRVMHVGKGANDDYHHQAAAPF